MIRHRKTPGLTRALLRDLLHRRSFWTGVLSLCAVLALILILTVRIPASITHKTAYIQSSTPVKTKYGTRALYTARTEQGDSYNLGRPAWWRHTDLLHPGDSVCLRIQKDRFTGRVTARVSETPGECATAPG